MIALYWNLLDSKMYVFIRMTSKDAEERHELRRWNIVCEVYVPKMMCHWIASQSERLCEVVCIDNDSEYSYSEINWYECLHTMYYDKAINKQNDLY